MILGNVKKLSSALQQLNNLSINTPNLSIKQATTLFKTFDKYQLQSYIDKIKAIQNTDTGNLAQSVQPEFNVQQAKEYAKALDGVSNSQCALLLSTQKTMLQRQYRVEKL
ncbi:MAG: hypothetical protein ACI4EJ_02925 [Bacteroides sp.]